jgi:hypothetical protein
VIDLDYSSSFDSTVDHEPMLEAISPHSWLTSICIMRSMHGCGNSRPSRSSGMPMMLSHCKRELPAQFVLGNFKQRVGDRHLELNEHKTLIVCYKDANRDGLHEHERFDFLGFTSAPARWRIPLWTGKPSQDRTRSARSCGLGSTITAGPIRPVSPDPSRTSTGTWCRGRCANPSDSKGTQCGHGCSRRPSSRPGQRSLLTAGSYTPITQMVGAV